MKLLILAFLLVSCSTMKSTQNLNNSLDKGEKLDRVSDGSEKERVYLEKLLIILT